jgi:TonB-dependent SusC/RagA subfamily outer membrane receptor
MTTLWMAYVALLGTLLAAAAAATDAALRLAGRSTRGVWIAAMAGTLALPAFAWVAATRSASAPQRARAAEGARDGSAALAALLARAEVRADVAAASPTWAALDRPLLAAWLGAAAIGLVWLALSRRRLRALTRRWRPATVAGEPVLVAPDAGPAAVAELGGRIVLPAWALTLDERTLALMLAHERSHLQARDPQLLAAATVAVALAPWNPALWWQLRRLRLAVEIDCDRRVLRRHPDVGAYGALLLDVARRGTPGAPRLAAALSAPTPVTTLERRIRTMTTLRPRHAAARALGLTTLGVGLALAACETPHPTAVRPETRVPLQKIKSASAEMASRAADPSRETLQAALRTHLPQVADGSVRARMVWFVADASGKIVKSAYAASPDGQLALRGSTIGLGDGEAAQGRGGTLDDAPAWAATLDPSTIASVDVVKFAPGRVTRDSVGVIWIALRAPGAAAGAPRPGGDIGGEVKGTSSEGEMRLKIRVAPNGAADDITVSGGARTPLAAKTPAAAPLYVIDGTELPGGPETVSRVQALPPERIASVEVIKGERAAAEYGARGANGVVKITTKKAATRAY